MSDDLISRKETVKMLRDYADLKCFNGEVGLSNGILKAVCYIENDNIPTAYDADKVIEQLENTKTHFIGMGTIQSAYFDKGIDKAIEIVKSGGATDD